MLASVTSTFWNDNIVSAGASGAIFGLYGYFLAKLLSADKKERKAYEGLIIAIVIYIVYNLLMGLAGQIDNAAHVGGLASGLIFGIIMPMNRN